MPCKSTFVDMENRLKLINLFQENNIFGIGIELGTYKGHYAKEILKVWSGKLYLVDVWRNLENDDYLDGSNQIDYKSIISECFDSIKENEDRCFIIRADSKNAIELFNDLSLDFVYIDANHKYEHVKEDLNIWFPKVRYGGIVSGHDYLNTDWYRNNPNEKDRWIWTDCESNENNLISGNTGAIFGVNPAVDEFCKQFGYDVNITKEWFGSWYFKK